MGSTNCRQLGDLGIVVRWRPVAFRLALVECGPIAAPVGSSPVWLLRSSAARDRSASGRARPTHPSVAREGPQIVLGTLLAHEEIDPIDHYASSIDGNGSKIPMSGVIPHPAPCCYVFNVLCG
jgi:hypothetical protein